MTPLEIITRLRELKTHKSKENCLKGIEPEHEFWVDAYHGLRPLVPYPVGFSLRDPAQHGTGVPLGVFPKILEGMHRGTLTESATIEAIAAFSTRCTKEEWKSWYKPILEKKLRIPVSASQFNEHCPHEYRLDNPRLPQMARIDKDWGFPSQFVLEPFLDAQRLLVILWERRSYVFLDDGTPVHRMLPSIFEKFATSEGVVLELYEEDGRYTIRDVLLWEQFLGDAPSAPVEVRRKVLEGMFTGQDKVEVIEGGIYDEPVGVRDDISAFFQAGYPGVVIRQRGSRYFEPACNSLVHPKRKSVLTCTKITSGKEGTKYEGRTEYIWGTGTMNRRKFETPVFHGLTFSQRGTSYQNREELVGKKFGVVSCGLDSNGKLMFPVFTEWKE